jgi:hypothetical protein
MNVYSDFAIAAFGRHATNVAVVYEFVALATTTRIKVTIEECEFAKNAFRKIYIRHWIKPFHVCEI